MIAQDSFKPSPRIKKHLFTGKLVLKFPLGAKKFNNVYAKLVEVAKSMMV
jgi:hypothetical protein